MVNPRMRKLGNSTRASEFLMNIVARALQTRYGTVNLRKPSPVSTK